MQPYGAISCEIVTTVKVNVLRQVIVGTETMS